MRKILTLTILIFCLFSTSIKAENVDLDFNNIKVKDKIENKIKTTKQNENKDYSTKFLIINIGAFGVSIFSILNLIKNEKNKINKQEPN